MWQLLVSVILAVLAAGMVFLAGRVRKFQIVRRFSNGKRWLSWATGLGVTAAALGLLALALGLVNAVIALLHLIVFWALCELIFRVVQRARRVPFQRYYAGGAALAVTAAVLTFGWYTAHHVSATRYALAGEKVSSPLRIVQFSDSHVGAIFDAGGLARHLERIQAEEPDIVVITGDFVDDDTSRADLLASCEALGGLKTTYGVFFCYGNHDRGYWGPESRGWTAEDLEKALAENGVTILRDQAVELGEDYCLIGREDAAAGQLFGGQRKSMAELMADVDRGRYTIVLDHQPNDYDAEAAAGADLVLSGHTHGGQFFPFNYMGQWTGVNDATYGLETRGDTTFIVSSGIADWALGFKTGCISEYVVVDIGG